MLSAIGGAPALLGADNAGSGSSGLSSYISAAAVCDPAKKRLKTVTVDYRIRSYKRSEDSARQTAIHFYIRNHGSPRHAAHGLARRRA
jgi:hypothetical protein